MSQGDPDTLEITGRTPISFLTKCNPLWWFRNDEDPAPPAWYTAGALLWAARNPFHNFAQYVLGVADQNYTVSGVQPVETTLWSDIDEDSELHRQEQNLHHQEGWKNAVLHLNNGRTLPFYSYTMPSFLFYWGWQPHGTAGFKLNRNAIWLAPLAPFFLIGLLLRRLVSI